MTESKTPPMFDLDPIPGPPKPGRRPEGVSAGQWLTIRQRTAIEQGQHPLTKLPLHPLAPADAQPSDRGRPHTCGDCAHRLILHWHDGTYAKCDVAGLTHSAATDCRAWWPGCTRWEAL